MPKLDFDIVHSYASQSGGISVPAILSNGAESVELLAFVDTGASNCLFQREHGELIGLEIESGQPKSFWTATGRLGTFGHLIRLEVLGFSVETVVYFFSAERIQKNLLGRIGWLDRIRFGLVEYDRTVYLASYDSDPNS